MVDRNEKVVLELRWNKWNSTSQRNYLEQLKVEPLSDVNVFMKFSANSNAFSEISRGKNANYRNDKFEKKLIIEISFVLNQLEKRLKR